MELICRKAETADIPKLNPLLAQLSGRLADPEVMAAKMKKIAKNEDAFLLVAEDKDTGDLLGSLFGLCFEDVCGDCRPILMIENVVTDDKVRRTGVGRKMFACIENWAREKACHYVILVSAMHRLEAHRFYEAIGYGEVKGFKKYL